MKDCLKFLLLAAAFFGTVHAQNDTGVYAFPKLDEQITDETDARYYFLMYDVFPDLKTSSADPYKNSASRSIRLRKLFGTGYSRLDGRREIGITHVRWLGGAGNRKYLVVLFAASLPDEQFAPDAETFYALAVFAYVRRKVVDWNVYNALHYKWTYEFDLIDAVDPQSDDGVELPKAVPVIKTERGAQIFWLLNSHAVRGGSVKNYAAIELRNNRLNLFFKDFPTLYDFYCQQGFEQSFEIVPVKPRTKAPPFELRVVSKIRLTGDCRAQTTTAELREIETYRAVWQTISKRRRVVSFRLAGKRVEIFPPSPEIR